MFKFFRIAVLLYILIFVALGTWFSRAVATDWTSTLIVTIYPIAGDGAPQTLRRVDQLQASDFQPVANYFAREAARYGHSASEFMRIQLGNVVNEEPPVIPFDGNILQRIWWGFEMRYWSYRVTRDDKGIKPAIKLFVIYHEPAGNPVLERSVGIQKGMFGIVHAFAARPYRRTNQIVMAHEILHTLGATDKYELSNGYPQWPHGFIDANDSPQYPQKVAEIMAGRLAISPTEAVMPRSLQHTRIGPLTATEIRMQDNE